jgi:hypothetical protein
MWQYCLQIEVPVEPILTLGQVAIGVYSAIEDMIERWTLVAGQR